MAKINKKYEKTTSFGEIIHVMEIKASIDNAKSTNMIPMILIMLKKNQVC